jgi:hypothetical protein
MMVVKGVPVEVAKNEGSGHKVADNAMPKYLGYVPANLAMVWNAMAELKPGKIVSIKSLIAAAAVNGAEWVSDKLAVGGAEMALYYEF